MNRVEFKTQISKVAVVGIRFVLMALAVASIWFGIKLAGKENTRLIDFGYALLLAGLSLGVCVVRSGVNRSRTEIWGIVLLVCVATLILVFGVSESLVWQSQNVAFPRHFNGRIST